MTARPGMDRKANNDRLDRIVLNQRLPDGSIPAVAVPAMHQKLTALLDELVDAAYTAGEQDAVDGYPED